MLPRYRLARTAAALVVLSSLAGACDAGGAEPTSTVATTTSSTFAPIEIVPVSTTVAAGVDEAVHQQLQERIRELAVATQQLRGLSYIQVPDVAIVASAEFAARMEALVAPQLTDERLALDEATYRLLGMYDAPPSLARAIRQLYSPEGAVAFYDGSAGQVVVDGTRAELTPLQDSIVVRALAWALIDQYHDAYDRLRELEEAGDEDAIDAFRTLVEGDAIAAQLRYLQSLSEDDQRAAAQEAADAEPAALSRVPDVVRANLALPGEFGVAFVDELVAGGGYAALDRAYDPPPASMEQVLHPRRFAVRETVRQVPELAVAVDGYTTADDGSFGEWRLRLLLQGAISPGLLTQTSTGWGGDAHQLLVNGDDLLFVYIYGGDTEDDAIEVAQALLALARGPMDAGDGVDSGGGVLWDNAGQYVFVDRIGDGLMFIAATSGSAGAAARAQIRVP